MSCVCILCFTIFYHRQIKSGIKSINAIRLKLLINQWQPPVYPSKFDGPCHWVCKRSRDLTCQSSNPYRIRSSHILHLVRLHQDQIDWIFSSPGSASLKFLAWTILTSTLYSWQFTKTRVAHLAVDQSLHEVRGDLARQKSSFSFTGAGCTSTCIKWAQGATCLGASV